MKILDGPEFKWEARALAESLIALYGYHAESHALRVASEAKQKGDSEDARLWSAAFNLIEEIRAERGISIVNKSISSRDVGEKEEVAYTAYKIMQNAGPNAEAYVLELIDTNEREGRIEEARKLTEVLSAIELLQWEMSVALAQPRH